MISIAFNVLLSCFFLMLVGEGIAQVFGFADGPYFLNVLKGTIGLFGLYLVVGPIFSIAINTIINYPSYRALCQANGVSPGRLSFIICQIPTIALGVAILMYSFTL